jgi:hypothetical protein
MIMRNPLLYFIFGVFKLVWGTCAKEVSAKSQKSNWTFGDVFGKLGGPAGPLAKRYLQKLRSLAGALSKGCL